MPSPPLPCFSRSVACPSRVCGFFPPAPTRGSAHPPGGEASLRASRAPPQAHAVHLAARPGPRPPLGGPTSPRAVAFLAPGSGPRFLGHPPFLVPSPGRRPLPPCVLLLVRPGHGDLRFAMASEAATRVGRRCAGEGPLAPAASAKTSSATLVTGRCRPPCKPTPCKRPARPAPWAGPAGLGLDEASLAGTAPDRLGKGVPVWTGPAVRFLSVPLELGGAPAPCHICYRRPAWGGPAPPAAPAQPAPGGAAQREAGPADPNGEDDMKAQRAVARAALSAVKLLPPTMYASARSAGSENKSQNWPRRNSGHTRWPPSFRR